MNPETITAPDGWLSMLLRLAAAAALGGVIGWEREGRNRGAGLRTNMMVSLGAASFIVLGLEFYEAIDGVDVGKVLAGIIGGVGFLGAGAIMQSHGEVRGLTTAAGIWACAAIGAASGAGLFALAGLTAAMAIVVLIALYPLKREISKENDDEDEN